MFKSPLKFVREYIEDQTDSAIWAKSHSSPASPEQPGWNLRIGTVAWGTYL